MKLAIDASRLESQHRTGVENYSYFLISELIKVVPEQVRVILYSRKDITGLLPDLPGNWSNKVLHWPLKYLWSQIRLSWAVHQDKPEVFFIPSHIIPFFIFAPSVITIHDISWQKFPAGYRWYSWLYLKLTTWWSVKKARAILTISEYSKNDLMASYPLSANKIFVHSLGTTLGVTKNNQTEGQKIFLVLGRVEAKKNILMLLEAYAKFLLVAGDTAPQLVLIGSPGYGFSEIVKRMGQPDLSGKVKSLGWQPDQVVVDYLSRSVALLFPGAYEGFGLPVLDAWNFDIPVLAARSGALKEVVAEAGLLLNPNDSSEWAAGLASVINDDIRANLVKLGRERLASFSWSNSALAVWQILKLVSQKIE